MYNTGKQDISFNETTQILLSFTPDQIQFQLWCYTIYQNAL